MTYSVPGATHHFEISAVNQEISHSTYGGNSEYGYSVEGQIGNIPNNTDPYSIQTEFYDTSGKLIYTDTKNLSDSLDYQELDLPAPLGDYSGSTKIQMDHADIKIMDSGITCGETTYKFNMNNMNEYNLN